MPQARLGVIVFHGMGDQVPFETLGVVVDALRAEALAQQGKPGAPGFQLDSVELIPCGERLLPVAHGTARAGEERRSVDLYEVYWAPITAGKVHLAPTLWFYLRVGWRGLRYSFGKTFERRWKGFGYTWPLRATTWFELIVALTLLLVLAWWLVSGELAIVAAADRAIQLGFIPARTLFLALGFSALLIGLLVAGLFAAIGLTALIEAKTIPAPEPKPDVPATRPGWRRLFGMFGCALAAGLPFLGLMALLAPWRKCLSVRFESWAGGAGLAPLLLLVGFLLASAILLWARRFLIDYTGDVAAYMSAHEVSRFEELRSEIQSRTRDVMQLVYGRKDGADNPFYPEVILVGHSLGSVIAYDGYNDLLLRAAAEAPDRARRTSLLLTFGSPLDKIALIFRSQRPDETIDIREDLATARQPILTARNLRPARWVNIYSPWDWIGGSIDFYGPLLGPGQPRDDPRDPVTNLVEHGWRSPAEAHAGYWTRRTFRRVLFGAVAFGEPEAFLK